MQTKDDVVQLPLKTHHEEKFDEDVEYSQEEQVEEVGVPELQTGERQQQQRVEHDSCN